MKTAISIPCDFDSEFRHYLNCHVDVRPGYGPVGNLDGQSIFRIGSYQQETREKLAALFAIQGDGSAGYPSTLDLNRRAAVVQ